MKHSFKILTFSCIILGLTFLDQVRSKDESSVDEKASLKDAFSRGAEAWVENCGKCHNYRDPQEFRSDKLRAIMSHMRVQARLSGQTIRDILAFLTGEAESTSTNPAKIAKKPTAEVPPAKEKTPTQTKPPQETKSSEMNPSEIKVAFQKHPAQKVSLKTGTSDAEELFNKDCAMCHGKDGSGMIPGVSDFTSSTSPLKVEDEKTLFERIKKRYKAMPAKGGNPKLTDSQIRELIIYMKRKFK